VGEAFNIESDILDEPFYTAADVARAVRVPCQTLRYWAFGRKSMPALFDVPDPRALSFANLLEAHVLNAMRTNYELNLRQVRSALETLAGKFSDRRKRHPLLTEEFRTNGIHLFINEGAINVSVGGQSTLQPLLDTYLERIEWSSAGFERLHPSKFYPFVWEARADEPKIISMTPVIAAGHTVIDGTGISTAVLASRFLARELPAHLALEYGLSERQVFEAIRWEGQSRSLDVHPTEA
jgi:uncharacterized protein (DUF433 family)